VILFLHRHFTVLHLFRSQCTCREIKKQTVSTQLCYETKIANNKEFIVDVIAADVVMQY